MNEAATAVPDVQNGNLVAKIWSKNDKLSPYNDNFKILCMVKIFIILAKNRVIVNFTAGSAKFT
jgi:hypothetical protein